MDEKVFGYFFKKVMELATFFGFENGKTPP